MGPSGNKDTPIGQTSEPTSGVPTKAVAAQGGVVTTEPSQDAPAPDATTTATSAEDKQARRSAMLESWQQTGEWIDGQLKYRILQADEADAACLVERVGFESEPVLTITLTEEERAEDYRREWKDFCELWSQDCAANGLSIVCVDTARQGVTGEPRAVPDGVVVGVFWVRDYKAPLSAEFEQLCLPCLSLLLTPLGKMDEQYDAMRPEITGLGQCVDLWMLSVHPEKRGKGIASSLTWLALHHALQRFPRVILEATSGVSAACARGCGMTNVTSVPYAETMPAPQAALLKGSSHDTMRLWETCQSGAR